jgi:hypothetical protein
MIIALPSFAAASLIQVLQIETHMPAGDLPSSSLLDNSIMLQYFLAIQHHERAGESMLDPDGAAPLKLVE